MMVPISFLLILQLFLREAAATAKWQIFLRPVDYLDRSFLERINSANGEELKLVFYVNSGEQWQSAGDQFSGRWSGYRTLAGDPYRYAQARVFIKRQVINKKRGEVSTKWEEVGLLNGIPTSIPGSCVPDLQPVLDVTRPIAEKPMVKVIYSLPVEGLSRELLVDIDEFAPGNQGDFGSIIIDESGFERRQSGIEISSKSGPTFAEAAGAGRVVLVSLGGGERVFLCHTRSGAVREGGAGLAPGLKSFLKEHGDSVFVSHPDGYTVRYANLDKIDVEAGQGVLRGARIGTVRELERLHLEIWWGEPLNPAASMPVSPWEFFSKER